MDYYLIKGESEGVLILHKDTCPQLIQSSDNTYVGYYFGEFGALQKVKSMTLKSIILCLECMVDIQNEGVA